MMKMEREFPSSPRWSGQPRQVCSRDAQFLGAVEVGGSATVDNCVCVCVSLPGALIDLGFCLVFFCRGRFS